VVYRLFWSAALGFISSRFTFSLVPESRSVAGYPGAAGVRHFLTALRFVRKVTHVLALT